MKLPFISKPDNMFLFTQMRTVSDHPVVTAAPHGGNVRGGCIWSNNKCHTNVSANVKLLCFLASSTHCDYYQRRIRSSHAKRWPVHSPRDPKADLSQDQLSTTFLSLFGSIRLQLPIPRTSSPHGQGVKLQFTRYRKNMGRYHAEQLLGESPESLSPGCGFFSHSVMKPTLHLSLFPSVVFRGARHLCWEELLFFHLKV